MNQMTASNGFASWCDALRDKLSGGTLPGIWAQRIMAPVPRRLAPPGGQSGPREGAVLIMLYTGVHGIHLPITQRSDRVLHHRGQISLPGGMRESRDQSLDETALRETEEEIGIPPAHVLILGKLTPLYVPASNSCVQPYIGCHAGMPVFSPNPAEVAEVIEMPIEALLDSACRTTEYWEIRDQRVRVPFYRVGSHKVWGATAMILGEFAAILSAMPRLAHIPNPREC